MNKKRQNTVKQFTPYLVLILIICAMLFLYSGTATKVHELKTGEFLKYINEGKVTEMTITPKSDESIYYITGKIDGYSDKETFKALFSQKALADCENADEQIDDFMERFGGKITSWKYYGMSASGDVEYGEYKLSEVWAMVEFESNEIAYTMFFHMYPIDIENPDNIGLYNIFVITSSIYDEMLNHTRKTIMQPEMAEHPIIWIYEG